MSIDKVLEVIDDSIEAYTELINEHLKIIRKCDNDSGKIIGEMEVIKDWILCRSAIKDLKKMILESVEE